MTNKERTLEEREKLEGYPVWYNTNHINRNDYQSRRIYLEDYRYLCKRYGFKLKIEGGWAFYYPYDTNYTKQLQTRDTVVSTSV